MKTVLISIQPKWCELIASGKKTVEVRKTRPKIDVPFKCYIYCTNSKDMLWILKKKERFSEKIASIFTAKDVGGATKANGKVIGEFVCDDIDAVMVYNNLLYCEKNSQPNKLKQMCLSLEEVRTYLGEGKCGFNWHISDLVIYDKPKELSEFWQKGGVFNSKKDNIDDLKVIGTKVYKPITRPPQSWCYVEKEGAE